MVSMNSFSQNVFISSCYYWVSGFIILMQMASVLGYVSYPNYFTGCPADWVKIDERCYKAFRYMRPEKDDRTWTRARLHCLQHGADLVTIANEREDTAVNALTGAAGISGDEFYWIGLSDTGFEGIFKWVDGSPLAFSKWLAGEPDSLNPTDRLAEFEDFVLASANKNWSDVRIDWTAMINFNPEPSGYVCEGDAWKPNVNYSERLNSTNEDGQYDQDDEKEEEEGDLATIESIPRGEKGDKGVQGPIGPQGPPGPTGMRGPQGIKGDRGDQGPKGSRGNKGNRGDQGIQGPRGNVGVKGERGDKGDRGDTGKTGQKGEKGDTGPAGSDGKVGPRGPPGLPGTIQFTMPGFAEKANRGPHLFFINATSFCNVRPDGVYPHPFNCWQFVTCGASYGGSLEMSCYAGRRYIPNPPTCRVDHSCVFGAPTFENSTFQPLVQDKAGNMIPSEYLDLKRRISLFSVFTIGMAVILTVLVLAVSKIYLERCDCISTQNKKVQDLLQRTKDISMDLISHK